MLATPEWIEEAAQRDALSTRLPGWLARVPLYRDRLAGAGLASPVPLSRLPTITKRDIRHNFPYNFLGNTAVLEALLDEERIELEHTSGTSEERTPLLLELGWWTRQERRALQRNRVVANALAGHPRRVTLASPVCGGEICYTGTPSRADRAVGDSLFLSLSRHPFLWGDADYERMVDEALEWSPGFLDVDPVYGVQFARYCERHDVRLPGLRFILASYEFVSGVHRRILERVFGVPVYNLYGSTETGHLLMEDEHGRMTPSYETAFLEVLDGDPQGRGDLVVTTLTNDYMPLIRYRIGDLVEPRPEGPRTDWRVHGRARDACVRPDGQRVTTWDVDQCFAPTPGIAHYELRHTAPRAWLLRYVPDHDGPSSAQARELQARLTDLLQAASVILQPVDALLALSSGKFQLLHPGLAPE